MALTEIILGAICIIIALSLYNKICITTCILAMLCGVFIYKQFSYGSDNTYIPEVFEGSVSGTDASSSGSRVNTSGGEHFSSSSRVNTSRGEHSIFDEDMFSDIQVFDNKLVDNEVMEVGLENCIKNCEGVCIGHGISGRGLCFPSNWMPELKNYDDSGNGSN